MKQYWKFIICAWLILGSLQSQSQITYYFKPVKNPDGCQYTYEIACSLRLDSVLITNIYFDDGTTGSFAFEAYVSYRNVVINSTLPTGNFYTFEPSIFSDNPNLNSTVITNDLGTVPLETASAGGFAARNSPTYTGSASAMGLAAGQAYSSSSLLAALGYDSATLHINLPCMDSVLSGNDDVPLPVLWSDLAAAATGEDVLLSWQTFMEQNNKGFSIERSTDGNHWSPIGWVPSSVVNGNTADVISYTYKDAGVQAGKYFYRIVQQDIDGKTTRSNIVFLSVSGTQNDRGLVVYPNPVHTSIQLNGVPVSSLYVIMDSYGRVVSQGNYRQPIDVSVLSAGIYWIRAGEKLGRFLKK